MELSKKEAGEVTMCTNFYDKEQAMRDEGRKKERLNKKLIQKEMKSKI